MESFPPTGIPLVFQSYHGEENVFVALPNIAVLRSFFRGSLKDTDPHQV